jgi:type IV pilus biogenesis protein CpaD/CtpE
MRMTILNSMCVVAALMAGCAENDAPRRTASIRHSAPKPPMTDAEKARASIEKQCAQRQVDRSRGVLDETEEMKRDKDAICGAFYRGS